jgi:hypothetical protein
VRPGRHEREQSLHPLQLNFAVCAEQRTAAVGIFAHRAADAQHDWERVGVAFGRRRRQPELRDQWRDLVEGTAAGLRVQAMDEVAALTCRVTARTMSYDLCGGGRAECRYTYWHAHVAGLIAAARPDADATVLAHALLATVDGALVHHLVAGEGVAPDRIRGASVALARAVVAGA